MQSKIYKTINVSPDTHQKVKVISTLERQTIEEWVTWAINKGYEAKIINHQASARSKKAITS